MSQAPSGVRYAEIERESAETTVAVTIDFDKVEDKVAKRNIVTGIGFLDHMLTLMAFHGAMHLGVKAEGDIHVDDHHTAEDVGIVIGQAMREALRNSGAIERYASTHTPMDEALVLVALDVSGRGQLHWDVRFSRERVGELATENIREFFQALAQHGGMTVHVRQIAGFNDHHIAEAIFKGFGRALRMAATPVGHRQGNSTKGHID